MWKGTSMTWKIRFYMAFCNVTVYVCSEHFQFIEEFQHISLTSAAVNIMVMFNIYMK